MLGKSNLWNGIQIIKNRIIVALVVRDLTNPNSLLTECSRSTYTIVKGPLLKDNKKDKERKILWVLLWEIIFIVYSLFYVWRKIYFVRNIPHWVLAHQIFFFRTVGKRPIIWWWIVRWRLRKIELTGMEPPLLIKLRCF